MSDFDPKGVLQILINSHDRLKYFPHVYIPESYIIQLIDFCMEIFLNEDSILTLNAPITVCGDTHGQFTDTLRIFDISGDPNTKPYLFLGDYVDRGAQSIENIVLLLTLKYLNPKTFYMIRGNHETEEISTVYGFRDECVRRYSFALYAKFMRLFDAMPFAAIISKTIFCVHGGIPAENVTVKELAEIKRPLEITDTTPVLDLLWSDPGLDDGFIPSPRGVSFIFGPDQAMRFLKKNNLSLIVRSHEFCQEGVALPFGKYGGFITVFSASNYCRTMNTSAILHIRKDLRLHFSLFTPQAHDPVTGELIKIPTYEEEEE